MNNHSMEIAKGLANLSRFEKRFQMGAVVSRRGRVLGVGFNRLKTAGAKYQSLFSVHAEISAIINSRPYKTDLRGSEIYIYRETADELPGLAKPCKVCMGAIVEAGIKKIVYSINIYPFYEEINL